MDDDLKQRLVPLEGGVNFRDMGGYPAQGGRRVKWRHLYRSGSTGRLTEADSRHLAERGIRTVIDFRTTWEQTHDPCHWAQYHETIYWSRDHGEIFGELGRMAREGSANADEAIAAMEHGYRGLPVQQGEAYGEMFRRIRDGHVPVVIHCTAGKDRTGGGAALILDALGVPRESIVADFSMTDRAVDLFASLRNGHADKRYAGFSRLDESALAVISSARASFIEAFLDSLHETFGSVESYLSEHGISPADLDAIRDELLE